MTGAALLGPLGAEARRGGCTWACSSTWPPISARRADAAPCRRRARPGFDAVVAGPGLGRTEHAATLVGAVLASDWPCVLDADALNLLADDKNLRNACERRSADTLLTPHPAEAGRLLKLSTNEVQADRLAAARSLAERYNAHVVLKGTVACSSRATAISSSTSPATPAWRAPGWATCLGNPGRPARAAPLRRVGAGARRAPARRRGRRSGADGVGPVGLTAGELADAARRIWNRWLVATRKLL